MLSRVHCSGKQPKPSVVNIVMSISGGVIQIQVGGCGNRIGCDYWKKIAGEYHIATECGSFEGVEFDDLLMAASSFMCTEQGRYSPRCVLVDRSEDRLEEILVESGTSKFIDFSNVVLVDTQDMDMMGLWEIVRRHFEYLDNAGGFQIVHSSVGEFASSVLPDMLLELRDSYYKKFVVNATVMPDVEPGTNAVSTFKMVPVLEAICSHSDGCIVYDNRALDKIWTRTYTHNVDLLDLNQLIVAHMSGFTSAFRFPGSLNQSYWSLVRSIAPIAGQHFFVPSLSPCFGVNDSSLHGTDMFELTRNLFTPSDMMVSANIGASEARFFGTSAVYQGCLLSHFEARSEMMKLIEKRPQQFVKGIVNYPFECAIVEKQADEHMTQTLSAITNTNIFGHFIKQIVDICTANRGIYLKRFLENKDENFVTEFKNQCDGVLKLKDLYLEDIFGDFVEADEQTYSTQTSQPPQNTTPD